MKYLATPQTVALRHKQYDFKYSCITLIAWNLFLVNFLTLCTYIYIYIFFNSSNTYAWFSRYLLNILKGNTVLGKVIPVVCAKLIRKKKQSVTQLNVSNG